MHLKIINYSIINNLRGEFSHNKMDLTFNGFLEFKFSNDQNIFENFPRKCT